MRNQTVTQLYRKCLECDQEKYYKNIGLKTNASGNKSCRSVCKECANAKRKKQYYENHEETLAKIRARNQKRWPQILEYARLWKAANPERRLKDDESYRQRRREREAAQSDGTLTIPAMRKLFGMAKACPLCGDVFSKDKPKSLDHVVPLAKGGPHSISNVSVVCRSCNIAKSDKEMFLI